MSGFSSKPDDRSDLIGTWMRKEDKLLIEITKENKDQLYSHIIAEGIEKFPCDVSAFPIYKNIVQRKENLWTCDFLVVTMGSCSTDYEEGIIRIVKSGDLEIICPGFENKYYSRLKPRYNSSQDNP
jgi:hypothetical protein